MPFVIGLTGGIGSGKSAAADEFARLGATLVDTDVIAHTLTAPGGTAIEAVRTLFGDAVIDARGAMDRSKVRARVFADPRARAQLEAILHPLIRRESAARVAAATGAYVVLVVPLLVESADYRRRVDRVLVVDCPVELQIARVRARSGLSEEEARRIIDAQVSREARLAAADDVIDNSGTLEALYAQVGRLHRRYLALAQAT
ncbi:MAG TPA: dephospho-CoA kinase [Burkholderiales bacterium]|nr:dephospho-CoA kinase [Burkholderiales bacterium]